MGAMGYRKKVSFKAGLTVAQISEFSLILVALGVAQGHVGNETVGLVTAVGLITITASTYMIYGSDRLYDHLEPALRVFERRQPTANPDLDEHRPEPEYVVIGLGRFGSTVVGELRDRGDEVLGVDFDPRSTRRAWDVPVVYGDADDPDLPEQLPLDRTRWVISTVRDLDTNLHLVSAFQRYGYGGSIAVAADDEDACRQLTSAGADVAIRPLHVAAEPLMRAIHQHGRSGESPRTA
jgi:hypothetical protein